MDNMYRQAMLEHLKQLQEELQEIKSILDTEGYLPTIAYRAAERNLQLLIEACIGVAKQSLKGQLLAVPSDARQSFAKLKANGLDASNIPWDKVVGMRNAIVHDYLKLNPERIIDVLNRNDHLALIDFAFGRLHSK